MFFIVSKIFWTLAMPLNALCFLALAGFALRFWRKKCGNLMLGTALAGIVVFGVVPVGPLMMTWLESHYEQPEDLPPRVNGIIVLGGMFDGHLSEARGQIAANDSVERMVCFTTLAKKYPNARKVFSGGSGDINYPEAKEATVAMNYLNAYGLDTDLVFYEMDSRNTYENAIFSKELMNPTEGQNWILVTSAFHMPRSVGIFEQTGWPVIPYPCDYRTDGSYDFFWTMPNVTHNYHMLNIAVKELIGSVVYYFTGKSAFILPRSSIPLENE